MRPLRPRWWQRNALWRSRWARERRARARGRETFGESERQARAILGGSGTDAVDLFGGITNDPAKSGAMSDEELERMADELTAEIARRPYDPERGRRGPITYPLSRVCAVGRGRGCRSACEDGGTLTADCACACHGR